MRSTIRASLILLALLCPGLASAAPLTFVASDGADAAPCSRARPCRTLNRAYAVTDTAGTITILDSGVFLRSGLAITKSLTIVAAPGAEAVLDPLDDVALNVGGASSVVILRHLTFRGRLGERRNGLVYNNGTALHVENCTFAQFPTKAILSLSHGQLFVRDSTFRENYIGVSLDAPTVATVDGSNFDSNDFGLYVGLGARAVVRDSVAAGNRVGGFVASSFAPAPAAELTLENCTASNNAVGIEANDLDNKTVVRLSNCQVSGNGVGLRRIGAADLQSRGNNTVVGNGTDVDGSVGVFLPI